MLSIYSKKNHLKWENNPDFNDEDFLLFLRVLTGDLQSIERVTPNPYSELSDDYL